MKVRAIWEFDADVEEHEGVDKEGLAKDLTQRELQYMLDNKQIDADDFTYLTLLSGYHPVINMDYSPEYSNLINRIDKDVSQGNTIPLVVPEKDKEYYLTFSATDLAKCNAFLLMLLTPNTQVTKYISDNLGISIRALSQCYGDTKAQRLKEYLTQMIEEIDRSQARGDL